MLNLFIISCNVYNCKLQNDVNRPEEVEFTETSRHTIVILN